MSIDSLQRTFESITSLSQAAELRRYTVLETARLETLWPSLEMKSP